MSDTKRDYDPMFHPYADVPERMRDLGHWTPPVEVAKRALAGHELFGLEDQPMTPRHKVFIAIAYAYAAGRLVDKETEGHSSPPIKRPKPDPTWETTT